MSSAGKNGLGAECHRWGRKVGNYSEMEQVCFCLGFVDNTKKLKYLQPDPLK